MQIAWPRSVRNQIISLVLLGLVAIVAVGGWWIRSRILNPSDSPPSKLSNPAVTEVAKLASTTESETIKIPQDSWQAAAIEIHPVQRGTFSQSVEMTGKIALNDDHVAHIFPLVDGRVEEVKVQFGDKVKKGELLVVVQSKEVGQAMLQLFQDRLQRDFTVTKDRWTQSVAANTQAMIKLIRDGAQIEEIERQLTNRPIGEYRDKLMTAYISHYKSRKHLDRLAPLSKDGAIPGKQLLEAEAEWNAARATLQSLVEQIQQDSQQASTISTQSVKELQTRVSVDETNLKILGFKDDSLVAIDPARQGEAIAHYPIYSPFDGTIISKDVVLLERVGPEKQILSIADLSTVWVTTDIYEEHLPLLRQLENKIIRLRSNAWPGKTFEAQIFYTGDVVHESTRTISMRAVAANKEGLLKPGMFVNVEFPSLTQTEVLQVPLTAIQEHQGKSFVFVHLKGDAFERRDVALGRRNSQAVEIQLGLRPGEMVVTSGGFALKTKMLAELLSE